MSVRTENGAVTAAMFDACVNALPLGCMLNPYYAPGEYRWNLVFIGRKQGALVTILGSAPEEEAGQVFQADLSGLGGPADAVIDGRHPLDEIAATLVRDKLSRREVIPVSVRRGDQVVASMPIGGPWMKLELAMFDVCWSRIRQ